MKEKTVIVIAGPTASGKTALAVDLATHYSTSVISADSRQCFRELNIGVAKPTPAQLEQVKHYFINSHSIEQPVNAALFETYALDVVNELFKTQDTVIMAGGTGLYIRAFTHGMDEMPEVPADIREAVITDYRDKGLSWLSEELTKLDPLFAASGEMQNPHRMLRAMEIFRLTGTSIRNYQRGQSKHRPFRVIKFALSVNKPELYSRINNRVDAMINDGLSDEVKALQPYKDLPPLQTVGYKELFEYYDGYSDFKTAVEAIKRNTRRYAKRQLTWFKKDPDYTWINPEDKEVMARILEARAAS